MRDRRFFLGIKRGLDILLSSIGLIVLAPVLIATALFIRFSLGSPVIFKQVRPGLYGRPFSIYKFRTMTEQKDVSGSLLPDHMRLTPLGVILRKLSLDELPQLFNVLRGDLSLVGPRPLLMEYLPLYSAQQARRHEVKPGITGWAQVNGRNALEWEEKFALDVWYVDNQSFWLDIRILLKTLFKVLKREGVSGHGCVTMTCFTGSTLQKI